MDILKPIINFMMAPFKLAEMEKKLLQVEGDVNFYKAQKLYWVLMAGLQMSVYKKDSIGRGQTYCNIYAFEILDARTKGVWNVEVQEGASLKTSFAMGGEIEAFDYDISSIMRNNDINKILNTPIPLTYEQGLQAVAEGIIRALTPEEAQYLANKGIPCMIISKKLNHVAVSAPNLKFENNEWSLLPFDEKTGCFTGNAGAYNDMMYMADKRGFGYYNWRDPEIKYWLFPTYQNVA